MSVGNLQLYLVDPSRPNATPTPIDGGELGSSAVLFGILLEMRVQNYYLHANASGQSIAVSDDPDTVRQQMLADSNFVVLK